MRSLKKGRCPKKRGLIAKWYGIYSSRQRGDHMARIVIPGGEMTATHVKAIAKLADTYAGGQNIVHDAAIGPVPHASTAGPAGTASRPEGCGPDDVFTGAAMWHAMSRAARGRVSAGIGDLMCSPYAKKAARLLSDSRDLDNLPRKYKVTFSGCGGRMRPALY